MKSANKKVLQFCHTDKIAALKLYEPYNLLALSQFIIHVKDA